jgi:hypothetical protein
MSTEKPVISRSLIGITARLAILIVLILATLAYILSFGPIVQNPNYHLFADSRSYFSIPNFFDVVSNLPFILIGWLGLSFCLNSTKIANYQGWLVFFVGVSLVSVGSMYYHWAPANEPLLWDRLPMTLGFMGLFVAIIGDFLGTKIVPKLLFPAVIFGLFSVFYWHWSDDLRLYYWVQCVPILTIPTLIILFKSGYTHQWLLLAALGWYILAKLAEYFDHPIYQLSQTLISGHTLKHLLAAISCYCILIMLKHRTRCG